MSSHRVLDSLFFPKSVAMVGVSANPAGWGGTSFLQRLKKRGYSGRLYPVNPKVTEVEGLKCYPDVKSLPEPPDHIVIATPAIAVPQVLRDCIARGVKNVHIFSSGFSETGEEEGRKLDEEITTIIQNSDLRVVGPNCMGIWVPASKLCAWGAEPKGFGSLAFLSQSGGHGEYISELGQSLGVYFSKIISFGNARGLQAIDFLEYLETDPDTKMIACYFEGMKDGGRITQLIKRINRTKPVFVWKGGLTPSGAEAVSSHTGSLAGVEHAWKAFYAQTGAVPVGSLEEVIDTAMAFQHLKPAIGRRTLLMGGGGGNSVALADICGREGLEVPRITDQTRQELNKFIRLAGNSTRNPMDVWSVQENIDDFKKAFDLSLADPNIDVAIMEKQVMWDEDDSEHLERHRKSDGFLVEYCHHNVSGKPIVIAVIAMANVEGAAAYRAQLMTKYATSGIPTYSTTISAARALSRFVAYHEFQSRAKQPN
ncbi:MAG TPA: CoA-binding protein [Dehalococcoidales bacterium]